MATLTMLRISQGRQLTRMAGPLLMRHVNPLAATATQSKTLMVTPRREARIYGPAVPGASSTGHWKMERLATFALIPIIPAAFMVPSTTLDYAVSAAVVLHVHWALGGVATDYIHGEYLRPITSPIIMLMSMAAFGGLCYLNYNDIGIVKAVVRFFSEL